MEVMVGAESACEGQAGFSVSPSLSAPGTRVWCWEKMVALCPAHVSGRQERLVPSSQCQAPREGSW